MSTTGAGADPQRDRRPANLLPQKLHHAASVTQDAVRTADFYSRILGMEMVHTVMDDSVPSTGQPFPYLHLFFRMADGSTIAFFESPSLPPRPASAHPGYDVFDHFAMEVESKAEVNRWYRWLVDNGVDVVGPTNHGIIYSIYFHDPDGRRLELTTNTDASWSSQMVQAQSDLHAWQSAKQAALAAGTSPEQALLQLIRSRKRSRD
jgi:catechol 2,3-dioxygenase-like lactoylglutathione lyase family enzyme